MRGKRGDIEWDTLMYWIIGIIVFIIVLGIIFLLSSKGANALAYLKGILGITQPVGK